MKSETGMTSKKLLLLMLGTLGALTVQAAENYVMIVYSDSAHGSAILEDRLDEAISELGPDDGRFRNFAEHVSLCVALTRTSQFEQATEYCDMAIAQSGREARRIRRANYSHRNSTRISAAPKAIALTNRGVLHAIAGEHEAARVLFEMAREADLTEEYVQNNLARLNASMDDSDS